MNCENERWAAENGESVEWARTMWWCDCPGCLVSEGVMDDDRPDLIAYRDMCEFCRHSVAFCAVLVVGPDGWRTPASAAKEFRNEFKLRVAECREHSGEVA